MHDLLTRLKSSTCSLSEGSLVMSNSEGQEKENSKCLMQQESSPSLTKCRYGVLDNSNSGSKTSRPQDVDGPALDHLSDHTAGHDYCAFPRFIQCWTSSIAFHVPAAAQNIQSRSDHHTIFNHTYDLGVMRQALVCGHWRHAKETAALCFNAKTTHTCAEICTHRVC